MITHSSAYIVVRKTYKRTHVKVKVIKNEDQQMEFMNICCNHPEKHLQCSSVLWIFRTVNANSDGLEQSVQQRNSETNLPFKHYGRFQL